MELHGDSPSGEEVAPDLLGQASFACTRWPLKDDKPARLQDLMHLLRVNASRVLSQM